MSTELYLQALTHSSYAHEHGVDSNERLEFLGDAVLELCISHLLHQARPDASEGTLSRIRQRLVNKETLADRARALDLGRHLRIGAGEQTAGLRDEDKPLSDVWEAMLGALYLDQGLEAAMAVVEETLLPLHAAAPDRRDPKSRLQEWCQKRRDGEVPRYEVVDRSGPDHAPSWAVEVRIGGERRGAGVARSKKDAEREAAEDALAALGKHRERG